jgi:biopolymer transport protein ExbD
METHRSRRVEERPRGDINVTPLVDVCLVLLIIFLVVTPMLKPVELPKVDDPPKRDPENDVVVSVTWPAAAVSIRKKTFDALADLTAELKEQRSRAPQKSVVLMADSRLAYHEIRLAMAAVRDAGYGNVGLLADREKSTKKK